MMTGKQVGYIRVSTIKQNPVRQLSNTQLDICFTDYASGKDTNRPKLQEMLNYIRDGDVIYVDSMDRLARNLADLRRIIKTITDKKAKIKLIKEGLEFTGDSSSPMSNLMLSLMGAFAEFEHSLIKERQMEGIAKAKARGVYDRPRKRRLSDAQVAEIKQRISQETETMKVNKTKLAKEFGISRETLYQYLKPSSHSLQSL
jgi:DNA invertase Pin-like site-specific DNA recombinase